MGDAEGLARTQSLGSEAQRRQLWGRKVTSFEVKAIGRVKSPLTDLESAPRQADEGAPEAWLIFEPEMLEGLRSIRAGKEVIVITWLDRARRDVLSVLQGAGYCCLADLLARYGPQDGVLSGRHRH